MGKPYELTAGDVPERRATSQYADIVADFISQDTESMKVTIEGMKPATLRAGLRRAIEGREAEGVKLAQRGEETYLGRKAWEMNQQMRLIS
jgi:hypothetical protein